MPAALSLVTTTFNEGSDRHRALGIWGSVVGLASAAGVLLGGVLTQTLGWRSVLLINPIICVLILVTIYQLLPDDRRRASRSSFDAPGSVLGTGGMLLLVWAVAEARHVGWTSPSTIVRLAGAALLLAVFVLNEHRLSNPLLPPGIFRPRGLAAANGCQLVGIAGLYGMLFVVTLYMQTVLDYSPLAAGIAYVPATRHRVRRHCRDQIDSAHRHRGAADVQHEARIEASWRERALNAEAILKTAHEEIIKQRNHIGDVMGQIRDLETEWAEDSILRMMTWKTTLKQQVRQLTNDNQALDDRLQAARANVRFEDRRSPNSKYSYSIAAIGVDAQPVHAGWTLA